jgi:hypothetical protein
MGIAPSTALETIDPAVQVLGASRPNDGRVKPGACHDRIVLVARVTSADTASPSGTLFPPG